MPSSPSVTKLLERLEDTPDLPHPPTRDELLKVLGLQARNGHVPAIRLLLEEQRRDADPDSNSLDAFDELAARRAG